MPPEAAAGCAARSRRCPIPSVAPALSHHRTQPWPLPRSRHAPSVPGRLSVSVRRPPPAGLTVLVLLESGCAGCAGIPRRRRRRTGRRSAASGGPVLDVVAVRPGVEARRVPHASSNPRWIAAGDRPLGRASSARCWRSEGAAGRRAASRARPARRRGAEPRSRLRRRARRAGAGRARASREGSRPGSASPASPSTRRAPRRGPRGPTGAGEARARAPHAARAGGRRRVAGARRGAPSGQGRRTSSSA